MAEGRLNGGFSQGPRGSGGDGQLVKEDRGSRGFLWDCEITLKRKR